MPRASPPGCAVAVAYQGAPGAFSEEAALRFAPGFSPNPCASFADVVAALVQGACARACLPLRNTLAGEVPGVAALIAQHGLRVLAEHDLPIRLQLMGPPGARLEAVRTAESHPMALRQCAGRLRALGLKAVDAFDTAGAAAAVSAAADPARSAVAGARAAELYGLQVLVADVQDAAVNLTRFAVLSR